MTKDKQQLLELIERLRLIDPFIHSWDNRQTVADAAEAIQSLMGLVSGLCSQFDHQGCTCTFSSDNCCSHAKARALLGDSHDR